MHLLPGMHHDHGAAMSELSGRAGATATARLRVSSDPEPAVMRACIPVIPSADLDKTLRLWVEGLGFTMESEMREDGRLVFCMLRNGHSSFMLNRRAGSPVAPHDFEGIRLYWAPADLLETRRRLMRLGYAVSAIVDRDYGQTEFFLTDDDGYSHCFGVPTRA